MKIQEQLQLISHYRLEENKLLQQDKNKIDELALKIFSLIKREVFAASSDITLRDRAFFRRLRIFSAKILFFNKPDLYLTLISEFQDLYNKKIYCDKKFQEESLDLKTSNELEMAFLKSSLSSFEILLSKHNCKSSRYNFYRLLSLTLRFEMAFALMNMFKFSVKYKKAHLEADFNKYAAFSLGYLGIITNGDMCETTQGFATLVRLGEIGRVGDKSKISYINSEFLKCLKNETNVEMKEIGRLFTNLQNSFLIIKKSGEFQKEFFKLLYIWRCVQKTLAGSEFEQTFHILPEEHEMFVGLGNEIIEERAREIASLQYLESYFDYPTQENLLKQFELIERWYQITLPNQLREFQEVWQALKNEQEQAPSKIKFANEFLSNYVENFSGNSNSIEIKAYQKKVEECLKKINDPKVSNHQTLNNDCNKTTSLTQEILHLETKQEVRRINVKKKGRVRRRNHKVPPSNLMSIIPSINNKKNAESFLTKVFNFGGREFINYEIEAEIEKRIKFKPQTIGYKERIWDWFQERPVQLDHPPYSEKTQEQKKVAKDKHTVNKIIDLFFGTSYSLDYLYTDPHTKKVLVAHCIAMSIKDKTGAEEKVLFVISKEALKNESRNTRENYHHRYPHPLTNKKLLDSIQSIRENVEGAFDTFMFPTLKESIEIEKSETKVKTPIKDDCLTRIKLGPLDTVLIESPDGKIYTIFKLIHA